MMTVHNMHVIKLYVSWLYASHCNLCMSISPPQQQQVTCINHTGPHNVTGPP